MTDKKEPLPDKLVQVKTIVLAVLALLTAWNTYTTQVTQNKLKITEAQLDTAKQKLEIQENILTNQKLALDTELRQREFGNNLKFKLYEEVRNAISGKDPRVQDAVVLIINEMLADDSLYRGKLSNILLHSNNTAEAVKTSIIDTQKAELQFEVDQRKAFSTSKSTSATRTAFTIDVFYLEEKSNEAQPHATQIADLLRQHYPDYTIRVRLLPRSVNARSGYGINFNQVRFEQQETSVAKEVIDVIRGSNILSAEPPVGHPVSNVTRNYMSVFVRN